MIEIILICVKLYIYLIILLRFFGKKEFSQLNVFDFVIFLILAELMALSVGSEDFPFYYSVIATFSLIMIDRIISILLLKNKHIRDILEGRPTYIIFDGCICQKNMKKLRYTIDDLFHQLRVGGVDSVDNVAFAMLETNGQLSIILKENQMLDIPEPLINDGNINDYVLCSLQINRKQFIYELFSLGYQPKDIFYCGMKEGEYQIIIKEK